MRNDGRRPSSIFDNATPGADWFPAWLVVVSVAHRS